METLSSADSPTEAKKSKTPRKRKQKEKENESALKQKSPAEFFAENKNIAGFGTNELENALAHYNSILTLAPSKPIWAVAENYRFEPALVEGKKLISEIGDMMSVQVVIEGSMNSSNPYFSSSWRRYFSGGFILDMGVHFIAGLRMVMSVNYCLGFSNNVTCHFS